MSHPWNMVLPLDRSRFTSQGPEIMNAAMNRAQANFDNRLPPDDGEREAAIERRTEALITEMWQDPEYLSDAMSDAAVTIGWYRKGRVCHPDAVRWLTLLRDGSDDMELARMLRESVRDAISDAASDRAEKEFGV